MDSEAPSQPDDTGLDGKVAIVTGGGAAGDGIGNGRAAAMLLARSGVSVLVVDREVELARRTVEMIAAEGGKSEAFEADVTKSDQCEAMVSTVLERYGRLDFLDNNVGIGSRGSVLDEEPESWARVMRINVESMFLASKHAIPAMIESGDGGSIVNVASIAAMLPSRLTAYATSKGAVISLTKAMAVDHGRDGIRVNCVAPGPVHTPMVAVPAKSGAVPAKSGAAPGMPDAMREARRRASLLGIEGTGWDVGQAVRFLLSDHARYITGHTLVVDGGTLLRGPTRRMEALQDTSE